MITQFNIHGAMVYVDDQGTQTGYEDVFTKIEMCRRHYVDVGLGAAYVEGDDAWRARLQGAYDELSDVEQPIQAQDRKRWEARNTRFHEVLVSGRASPWTLHILRLLARQGERYRRCSIGVPNSGRDVHTEHRELFELAMQGNEARAALALEAHIRATPDLILRAVAAGTLRFLPG